jgi:hypothetical protein
VRASAVDTAQVNWHGGGRLIPFLVACTAVLLLAGTGAAVTVAPPAATSVAAGGRVGATGFGDATLIDEPVPTGSAAVTVAPSSTTVPPPSTSTPTTRPQATTTTTVPPAPATTTTLPARPAGNLAPATSWTAEVPGLSLRMRLDGAPVAGQAVRFHLDFTSVDACCHLFVDFGDDQRWILHDQPVCTFELTPGAHRAVVSHTYAEPKAYLVKVSIHDGDMCKPLPAGPAPFNHIELPACVAVGPGNAGATGCPPPPNPYPVLPPPR